ncbi:unnamed protein product, partial [Didymodactylos carnosus]
LYEMPFLLDKVQWFRAQKQARREKKKKSRKPKFVPLASSLRCYPVRFGPDTEVIEFIHDMMDDANLKSVSIIMCLGSIKACVLRIPNTMEYRQLNSTCEIVSITGTFDCENGHHVRGIFNDDKGTIISGDIESLTVYKTVEIVLAECQDVIFSREHDSRTGSDELVIKRKLFKEMD